MEFINLYVFLRTFLMTVILIPVFVLGQDGKKENFYVKPGAGTLSVQQEVRDYRCKFSYAAQGGTHEEWTISLDLEESNGLLCSVERPSSYIFFEHFKLELTGPGVSIAGVDILGKQRGNKPLDPKEYKQDATSVSSTSDFKHEMEKVTVFSYFPRDDL